MDTNISKEAIPKTQSSKHDLWIFCGAGIALIFVLEGPLAALDHGGIFSFFEAIGAAKSKAPVINVDQNALRFPIVCATFLLITAALVILKADINKKRVQYIALAIIFIVSFTTDAVFGGELIGNFIKSKGYIHCMSGDHSSGNGKGRRNFSQYILNSDKCPSRPTN